MVRSGLAEGDQVLRNPGSSLKDGQKVEAANGAAPAPAAAPAAATVTAAASGTATATAEK
ncbi:hypothetical protein ACFS07_09720 [Undibacterium arcticum]